MPGDMLTDDYGRSGGLRDDHQRPTATGAGGRMQGTAEMCARLGGLLEEETDDGQQAMVIGSGRSQVDPRTTCPSNPSTFALLTAMSATAGDDACGGGVAVVTATAEGGNECSLGVRKSANMTECVAVPSSEHVAEIVGRQGCKIKALRAKTNTYIKTPVRGDEPVFVVTGRREDVTSAKREILSAAEHFSQIRASRRSLANRPTPVSTTAVGVGAPSTAGGASGTVGGQVTQEVRVPFRVVGLVVGPKGATVKRIQQETQTYIVTPSRDKDPVFEIIGTPENVERARREIESYISLRTKGELTSSSSPSSCSSSTPSGGGFNNSWTNLNHHQHQQQTDSPPLDDRQSSRTTADLLGLLMQSPIDGSCNSIFTSYNNILNLGLGGHHQLRLSKTGNSSHSAQRCIAGSSADFAPLNHGRPFSLDAADLFDARMLSSGDLLQQQQQLTPLPSSAKWRSSYESVDDILCTASSSSSSSSSSSEQQQQQQQLQGRSTSIVNPDNRWPEEASHRLPPFGPIFGHQGAVQVGRGGGGDGAWSTFAAARCCDDHSSPPPSSVQVVRETILGMCVGSLYAGSLFNSSCPDMTLVPDNVVHLCSGSVSEDSSSTSPTDFGLLMNGRGDFEKKPCGSMTTDSKKVESSAARCPTPCY